MPTRFNGENRKNTLHLPNLEIFSIFSSPPTAPTPKISGWNLEDNQYKIKWFDGDLAPKAIDISTSKEGNDDYLECDINDSGISFKIL